MIRTKKDLKFFLKEDFSKYSEINGKNMLLEFLKGNIRAFYLYRFIKILRITEYYQNNQTSSFFHSVLYILYKHRHQRLQMKTQIFVHTNVCGPGLYIAHPGFCWADSFCKMGKNCSILPRVLIGKKRSGLMGTQIFIGDNCYIGTGSTILGPVKIGNNVIIAANSLVNKDIPDNCVVAGNPARILKVNK